MTGRRSPPPRARRLPRRWRLSRAISACTELTGHSSAAASPAAAGRSRSTWRGERSRRAVRSGLSRCHSRLRNSTSEVERDITASGLAGLTVENRLLVDGQNIRDDPRFLPDREGRPVTEIGADKLLELTREPEPLNRPYQCIRLQTWDGDLVLSVFVNFTKRGTVLLAEVQHYLLAPLQPDYRQADRLASWSLGQRLRTELRNAPAAVTRHDDPRAFPDHPPDAENRPGLAHRASRPPPDQG